MNASRRSFLKIGALAGSGLMLSKIGTYGNVNRESLSVKGSRQVENLYDGNELLNESYHLLKSWGEGLLALQVKNKDLKGLYGGIFCPSCAAIHGRSADTIFPLLFLAEKTGDKRYVNAALDVYDWMENMVSLPDGSWVNEISVSSWTGTTVFSAIALAESLIHFGHLLDNDTKQKWEKRLIRAGEFLYKEFTINTGNINYPVSCSYALVLIGKHFDRKEFTDRGRELAHQALHYFTPNDKLLYGEGHPVNVKSAKGCYSVDLGYNVEESLPSLVMYGQLTNDTEVLDLVTESLKAHLEFMLPDGAWDNSWGTRNFKWTYWGSRTSDGCQPAYALMMEKDPAFYKAALLNTRLMASCTHDNLLYGGPHYVDHGILPCVHHTLGHSKALTTLLVKADAIRKNTPDKALELPREREYGVKLFTDIQTWLIAKNNWRATITGFDQEYSMKGGHATGGALTMLWHPKAGPVIVSSMNNYQLVETSNMQRNRDAFSMSLTPRFEVEVNHKLYSNSNDLKAVIDYRQTEGGIAFVTRSSIVDENQILVPGSPAACDISYMFNNESVIINAKCQANEHSGTVRYWLPIVASGNEKVTVVSQHKIEIRKPKGIVVIEANSPLNIKDVANGRIFNFVPGMEAIPIELASNDVEIKISVR
ncbi:MAG: hypothetical protein Q8928_05860 [Bacteroidota bacterium]|nr:hypothetical protein [Bacteroidota bacterium]